MPHKIWTVQFRIEPNILISKIFPINYGKPGHPSSLTVTSIQAALGFMKKFRNIKEMHAFFSFAPSLFIWSGWLKLEKSTLIGVILSLKIALICKKCNPHNWWTAKIWLPYTNIADILTPLFQYGRQIDFLTPIWETYCCPCLEIAVAW